MAQQIKIWRLVISGSEPHLRKFTLGDAIAIIAFINVDSADEAKITIEDAFDEVVVDAADMTQVADGIYSFVYQSEPDVVGSVAEGRYDVFVRIKKDTIFAGMRTHIEFRGSTD